MRIIFAIYLAIAYLVTLFVIAALYLAASPLSDNRDHLFAGLTLGIFWPINAVVLSIIWPAWIISRIVKRRVSEQR